MRAFLLVGTSMLAAVASSSVAETIMPHAVRPAVDENGVDVVRLSLDVRQDDLRIGSGDGELIYSHYLLNGIRGANTAEAQLYDDGASTAIVAVDNRTASFFGATSYTTTEADGSSLTRSGTEYTYVDGSGLTVRMTQNASNYPVYGAGRARVTEVVYPNGVRKTYTYRVSLYCPGGLENRRCPAGYAYAIRLASIANNLGNSLDLIYESDALNDLQPGQTFESWSRVRQVRATNNSVGGCASSACLVGTADFTQSQDASGNITFTAADALGRVTTYRMSPSSSFSVQAPGSPTNNLSATFNGSTVSSIVRDGVTTSYAFSDAGSTRTTTATDAAGNKQTYVSDLGLIRVTRYYDQQNRLTQYDYDANGRLTKTTFPEGNFIVFSYDARGNVTQRASYGKTGTPEAFVPLVTKAGYDATCGNPVTCNQPSSTEDARGNVTTYGYDPTHGGVTSVTRPAVGGVQPQRRYAYTGFASAGTTVYKLTQVSACQTSGSCVGGTDEARTSIGYGIQGGGANPLLPVSITAGAGDGSIVATTTMGYDAASNLVSVDGPVPGASDITEFAYDAARQPTAVIGPDPDGGGPRRRRAMRMGYDLQGRTTTLEEGVSDAGLANFSATQVSSTTYASGNRLLRQTMTAGGATYGITGYGYDALGRPICAAVRMDPGQWNGQHDYCSPQTNGSDGPDRVTQQGYDATGRVTIVQSAFGTPDATIEQKSFTPNGQVASVTDGNGNVTSYGYDARDRLQTTTYPGGSYEQLGYDANGNVTSRRLRDGQTLYYTYDPLNRRILADNPNTSVAEVDASYSYDNLDRILRAGDQNGWYAAFEYDALGRVTRQFSNLSSNIMQYDAAGRMTRQTWADGFFATYEYDAAGAVTAIRENGGFVLASFGYDDLGRRTSISRGNGTTTSYSYDGASRLNGLAQDLAGTAQDLSLGFVYNPAGQIASRTSSSDGYAWGGAVNVDRTYSVNGLNQYTQAGGVGFGYDARGNLINSGGTGYGYNSRNEMTSGPNVQLAYRNPAGLLNHLIRSNGSVTNFDYVGSNMVTEIENGAVARRYVYGGGTDEPLVWYEGSGTNDRRWLHADERGSVVAVTNGAGSATVINSYDEYGIPGSGNQGRFQYTGQKWVPELGVYDYKARMYSPTLGRFMQTDPIGYADGMNWYNYVGGDPINAVDPSGLGVAKLPPVVCPLPDICVNRGRSSNGSFGHNFGLSSPFSGGFSGGSGEPGGSNSDVVVYGTRPRPSGVRSGGRVLLPQNDQPTCPGSKSIFASIAEGADTVGDVADGVAIGSAALGLITAPTGAGGAFFGGTALVAGVVGRVASGVSIVANLADGNYGGAGAGAAGLVGGHVAGRIVGGAATSAYARNRMFGNLSAGQQRRVDLFSDTGASAGSRMASRTVCR